MEALTLTTMIALLLAVVTSAGVILAAVRVGLAGHLLIDGLVGGVCTLLLITAFPPLPGVPNWAPLGLVLALGALCHVAPAMRPVPEEAEPLPDLPEQQQQQFAVNFDDLEQFFDFEEVP